MRRQASLRPNPSLMFERREEPAGTDNQTTVQVSVPLDLFRRSARIEAADREIDVVNRSVGDRARVIVNDVTVKYGLASAALRDRSVADDVVAAARRELELLRQRVQEGASPPLDRDLLDVDVRQLESMRLLATARAESAMFELKRAVGLTAATPLMLTETLEVLAPVAALPDAGTPLQRPDVLEAEARVQLADARIGEAQAAGRLDLSVFGSYMRMDAGFPQQGFGTTGDLERVRGVFHYVSGGAMVIVPLWNRNQGRVEAARAERVAAAARLEAVQLTAEAERAAALAQVTHTGAALDMVAGSLRLARQNLDVVRQTYELGRGTLREVLIEQRRYLESEREYTAALQRAFEARASMQFAQGDMR
jgi:cobalt-zinc-cadmium efflux system outer membrane protein